MQIFISTDLRRKSFFFMKYFFGWYLSRCLHLNDFVFFSQMAVFSGLFLTKCCFIITKNNLYINFKWRKSFWIDSHQLRSSIGSQCLLFLRRFFGASYSFVILLRISSISRLSEWRMCFAVLTWKKNFKNCFFFLTNALCEY